MWPTIAPDNSLKCAECRHPISAGRPMLSELPDPAPKGLSYQDFAAYCIGCSACQARGKHACYVRRLENQPTIMNAPRSLPCARCGLRIAANDRAVAQVYYEWPSETEEGLNQPKPKLDKVAGLDGGTIIPASAAGLHNPLSFSNLTEEVQRDFFTRGMRNGDWRLPHEAQHFYQQSIPDSIKAQGSDAVSNFIQGKDASHRFSVHNRPDLASDGNNVRWEDPALNRARGSGDMTSTEWNAASHQTFLDSSAVITRQCLGAGLRSAFYAGLMEAPITAIENYILVKKGVKSQEQALKDAALDIGKRATAGAVVGVGIKLAILAGAGPVIMPAAPILMTAGVALYGYTALKRIIRAYEASTPLHLTGTWFCSPRCQQKLAWETGWSALLNWQEMNAAKPALQGA